MKKCLQFEKYVFIQYHGIVEIDRIARWRRGRMRNFSRHRGAFLRRNYGQDRRELEPCNLKSAGAALVAQRCFGRKCTAPYRRHAACICMYIRTRRSARFKCARPRCNHGGAEGSLARSSIK